MYSLAVGAKYYVWDLDFNSIHFNPILMKTVCYKRHIYSDAQTVPCNLRSWRGVSQRRSRSELAKMADSSVQA